MKWKGQFLEPSARLAVVLTFTLLPGAGQALNREWGKAVSLGAVSVSALLATLFFFFRGLYLLYESVTTLGEIPPVGGLFLPALGPFLGLLALYVGAAWDAWAVGRRLEKEEAEAPEPAP